MNRTWKEIEAEERRRTGAHRWDYVFPSNLWESWPWWFRWPVAAALTLYFGGGILIPLAVLVTALISHAPS